MDYSNAIENKSRRCTATAKSTGERCKNISIVDGKCRAHRGLYRHKRLMNQIKPPKRVRFAIPTQATAPVQRFSRPIADAPISEGRRRALISQFLQQPLRPNTNEFNATMRQHVGLSQSSLLSRYADAAPPTKALYHRPVNLGIVRNPARGTVLDDGSMLPPMPFLQRTKTTKIDPKTGDIYHIYAPPKHKSKSRF